LIVGKDDFFCITGGNEKVGWLGLMQKGSYGCASSCVCVVPIKFGCGYLYHHNGGATTSGCDDPKQAVLNILMPNPSEAV